MPDAKKPVDRMELLEDKLRYVREKSEEKLPPEPRKRLQIPEISVSTRTILKAFGIGAGAIGLFIAGYLGIKAAGNVDFSKYMNTRQPTSSLVEIIDPTPTKVSDYIAPATPTAVFSPVPSGITPMTLDFPLIDFSQYGNYQGISLEGISTIRFKESNLGLTPATQVLEGIPFDFGWHFESQSEAKKQYPTSFSIKTHVQNPTNVYFLIQAGWGYDFYKDKKIGEISLQFSDGAIYHIPLILGENVRDWSVTNERAVRSLTSTFIEEAWAGDSTAGKGRIDMLTIPIVGDLRGRELAAVEFVDTSVEYAGSKDPNIHILGITVETEPGVPAFSSAYNTIPQELVDRLAIIGTNTESEVHKCVDTSSEGRTQVEITANQPVPAGTIFATDFSGAGRSWTEFPVFPICRSGSWGLFQSMEAFTAPYKGAYMLITSYTTQQSTPEPLRTQTSVSIGTGPLADATFSDGMAPYGEDWLFNNNFHRIQRIRMEEQPDGCDMARYDSEKIWLSFGYPAELLVNGESIGKYTYQPNSHGFVFAYPVKKGDTLCVSPVKPMGYHIVIGPDLYYSYDSYCYRGHCD